MRFWSTVVCAALAASGIGGLTAPAMARPAERPSQVEVVGGVRAAEGQFPWMVRLSVGCGGALVAPRFVLTAGHCVRRSGATTAIQVTAGSADLKSSKAVTVSSEYVKRAPGFRDAFHGEDWALIRLQRPLDLPTLRMTTDDRYDRGRFTIMGWGTTREGSSSQQRYLRTAQVPLVADSTCDRIYEQNAGYVPDEMICAGYLHRGGVDTCQGDSGGPMVRRDASGGWVEVGIVSFGNGCARADFPGVYTQVSTFAGDIQEAIDDLNSGKV